MARIRLGIWTLLVGTPLACVTAHDDTRERTKGDEPRASAPNVTASYELGAAPLATTPKAVALGSGGTSSSADGGRPAGGHAGKNTRNGKDSHNTE